MATKLRLSHLILILSMFGCINQTYVIDKYSVAIQMTDLKIQKGSHSNIEINPVNFYSETKYSTDLSFLIIKNGSLTVDSILPFEIKFFLNSGIKTNYFNPKQVIFKEGYFLMFDDKSPKPHPRCKTCKLNIDSIEKIEVRGYRLNKVK